MLGTLFSNNLAQLGFDSIIRPQGEFSANSTSASVIVQLAQPEPSPVLMGSDPAAWGVLRRVEIGVVAVKDTGAAISIDLHEGTRRLLLHFLQSDLLPTFPFVFHGPLSKHVHEDTRYLHSIASSLNKISGTFGSSKALLWRREIKSLGIALHHLQCQVEKRTDDVLDRSNDLAESASVAPKQSFNAMFVKAGIEIGLIRRIKKIPKLSGGMNDDLLFDDMGLTLSSAQMYSVNEVHKALSVEIEAADSLQHIRARAARSESPMEIMSDHGSILNDGGDCEEDVEMLLDDDEI